MANLPPDTRIVGQGDPAADFDALVDVLRAITGVAAWRNVGTGAADQPLHRGRQGSDGAVTLDGPTDLRRSCHRRFGQRLHADHAAVYATSSRSTQVYAVKQRPIFVGAR